MGETHPLHDLLTHLRSMTDAQRPDRYLYASVARVTRDDARHYAFAAGEPAIGTPRMRCASVSKMATALAINAVANAGHLDLEAPVAALLGWDRDPGITVLHLLSHRSGLTDLGGYIFDPPDPLRTILTNARSVSEHLPGSYLRYCNLGYILLGQVLERATGQRFDQVLRETVLEPAGIRGGFNWVGVALQDRANRKAMWQRRGESFVETTDGAAGDWDADLIWRDGEGRSLMAHRLGDDAPYFSPHAGLRVSVPEMARLSWFLGTSRVGRSTAKEVWRYDAQARNGETCGGLFLQYGRGVTIYQDHPKIPGHLIGHAGHALGFTGGAWFNFRTKTAWAYALIGAPDQTDGLDDEVFYPDDELQIMRAF